MSKAATLVQIYEAAAKTITGSGTEWMSFLDSMARFYKLSYDNNVMVYTQRPNASLLATYNDWNDKVGRRINAGTKGIAVINMSDPVASLTHLYDFGDTNGPPETFEWVLNRVWQLSDEYKPRLVELFGRLTGVADGSIDDCIFALVQKHTEKRLPALLDGIDITDEGSVLYGLPPQAVNEQIAELAFDSVLYTVFKRCGLSTEHFQRLHAFDAISHIDHTALFCKIGYAISQSVRPILQQINQAINQINRQLRK